MMKYRITNHAQKRYAERIQDKGEIVEINSYVNTHSQKINENINKMIEHGTLIFEGKQFNGYNNVTQIFIKDTWIILVDPSTNNVVTLYSIDLGLGNEYNKEYIARMMELIDKEKKNVADAEKDIESHKEDFKAIIEENENTIREYSSTVKYLKQYNEDLQKVIDDFDDKKVAAQTELRRLVGKLIGKKSF